MRKYISLNRLVTINLFTILVWGIIYSVRLNFDFSFVLIFLLPLHLFAFFLIVKPFFYASNKKRPFFFGRKRILITLMCTGSILVITFYIAKLISLPALLGVLTAWSVLLSCLQQFGNEITALLYKVSGHYYSIGIIGNNEKALRMANHLRNKNKFSLIKYFDDYDFGLHERDVNSKASIFSFVDFTKEKGVKELYVSTPAKNSIKVKELIQEAEKHCIRVNFIDVESEPEIAPTSHIRYMNGVPVLQRYKEPVRRPLNHITKRIADIIISSFVIFFIFPWLIPLVGILIKLESRGPIFFRQLRSGRDNESFVCLKFRSMRVNEESDHKQATFKDSRVTKIGAFLRKTSLDEFPQFINVFKGEMSIVGPRPHMLRHTEEYSKLVKHYMDRLYLKPGITGWAQVNGYRGETLNLILMEKRVAYDIEYMERWSLWFDIKIIILTFWNVLVGEENAY